MNVLMLRPSYLPEQSGGNHEALDLINDVIDAGGIVTLVAPAPYRVNNDIRKEYKGKKVEVLYNGKLVILRFTSIFTEKKLMSRGLRMLSLSFRMALRVLTTKNIDVVMSHSMPPFLAAFVAVMCKLKKLPVVYWEHDIVSESLITTGYVRAGGKRKILYSIARSLEKFSSKHSNRIVTISEAFKKRQISLGKNSEEVDVIYDWVDADNLKPIPRENNSLFDEFKLDRSLFYVTYCGNFGLAQNVEILIDVAKELEHINGLMFVLVGGGVREDIIKKYITNSKVKNVALLPFQPLERVAEVYSLGNVGIVTCRKGTVRNGFPSKTWSIMSAGQAIVSCFDLESELSNVITDGQCGLALEPESPKDLRKAIEYLFNNPEKTKLMGENGRNMIGKEFSRKRATDRIIQIFDGLSKGN